MSLGSPPWCDLEDRFGRDAGSDLRDLLRRLRALELEGRLTLLGRLALRDLLLRNRLALRTCCWNCCCCCGTGWPCGTCCCWNCCCCCGTGWPCGAGWLPPDAAFVKIVVPQRRVGPSRPYDIHVDGVAALLLLVRVVAHVHAPLRHHGHALRQRGGDVLGVGVPHGAAVEGRRAVDVVAGLTVTDALGRRDREVRDGLVVLGVAQLRVGGEIAAGESERRDQVLLVVRLLCRPCIGWVGICCG